MLTTAHKANILRRAGITVPPAATNFLLSQDALAEAVRRWESTVDNLFVAYAAARAAKSLRDAEEERQLSHLQQLAQRRATHAAA